ncbi:MAG: alginate lyase family protein [Fusobacterium sp.]
MIIKILRNIKKYGFFKVVLFCLKTFKKKIQLKILRDKVFKNKVKINFVCLENFKTDINFYFNEKNKNEIIKFYNENLEIKNQVIRDANKILEHRFNFLSGKKYQLDKNINWNQDFKTGFIWNNKFYKNIKIVDLNNNADVKIPWELSRFQHIFTLGKAYWITNDEKYYLEFKVQIIDWIEKNPIYMTVNWTCTMDVAIRSVNFIFGYFLFKELIDNDKGFSNKLNNSLFAHGKYIIRNLEKGIGLANNHYLSDLNGLIFLGIYFKKLNNKESNKWLKLGVKELEKEMMSENNEDGSNYETSILYHRLVTELMFYPMLLCEKNNIKISDNYKNRLKKMFKFMGNITKKNGEIPLIGDVDNGRLVILSKYYDWKISDCRHIISLGGEYFNNNFLKQVGAGEVEDKLWIFDSIIKYKENFNKKSIKFDKGGYYLLNNKSMYCLIRCGSLSLRGQGGHSHNDQLSFELNVLGEDFIIDTGTGVYTANKNIRNLFRSTKMHNTVAIEGYEQNDFNEEKLFSMPEQTFSKCIKFNDNYFEGKHYGYKDKLGCVHNRKIELKDKELIIEDILKNTNGIVCFNLSEDVNLKEEKNNLILEKNNVKLVLDFGGNEFKIKDSFISKKYGDIKTNKRVEIYFRNNSAIKIKLEEK